MSILNKIDQPDYILPRCTWWSKATWMARERVQSPPLFSPETVWVIISRSSRHLLVLSRPGSWTRTLWSWWKLQDVELKTSLGKEPLQGRSATLSKVRKKLQVAHSFIPLCDPLLLFTHPILWLSHVLQDLDGKYEPWPTKSPSTPLQRAFRKVRSIMRFVKLFKFGHMLLTLSLNKDNMDEFI